MRKHKIVILLILLLGVINIGIGIFLFLNTSQTSTNDDEPNIITSPDDIYEIKVNAILTEEENISSFSLMDTQTFQVAYLVKNQVLYIALVNNSTSEISMNEIMITGQKDSHQYIFCNYTETLILKSQESAIMKCDTGVSLDNMIFGFSSFS